MAARPKEIELATQRKYRKFSAQQKLEVVLAGLRGDRSVKEVCRDHEIAETLYYSWRDKLLEVGASSSRARRSARASASCESAFASSSVRSGARPMSWR